MNEPLRYLSVCSGIEATSVAWAGLPMQPKMFSETAEFPSAVLAQRFPEVPNAGDLTSLLDRPPDVDLIVGGTPCQSFSVAGYRKGLEDPRGSLSLAYAELCHAIRSTRSNRSGVPIAVWENVPGILSDSSNGFGQFLAALVGESEELRTPDGKNWPNAGVAHGPKRKVAWRVLDARYWGVPQKRRRVFVVSTRSGERCPGEILFERTGGSWNAQEIGETHKKAAGEASSGFGVYRQEARGQYTSDGTASTCKARDHKEPTDLVVHQGAGESVDVYHENRSGGLTAQCGRACALRAGASANYQVVAGCGSVQPVRYFVRRLMPVETERLQGFPDGWTDIAFKGKPAADSRRYEAMGNAMAVPCMRFIGHRICLKLGL